MNARNVPLIALLAAFSFVIMMFNIPLPGGTTGHAIGAALAAIIIGPEIATIAISIALIIQAFFFGDGPYVLRRQANEWIAEPSPGGIRAMCEKDGRVFAVTDQSPQGLFVRRDRGYWANVSSDASWQAAVAGREFGHVSGLAGALDDGYLLMDGRIEHYDGHTFTELHTDSGLGLRAIGYAGGWALGLGEDGFVYSRNRGAARRCCRTDTRPASRRRRRT